MKVTDLVPAFTWAQDAQCAVITISFGREVASEQERPATAILRKNRLWFAKSSQTWGGYYERVFSSDDADLDKLWTAHNRQYGTFSLSLELAGLCNEAESYHEEHGWYVRVMIKKKVPGRWAHLLSPATLLKYGKSRCTIDADLWCDSDDDEEGEDLKLFKTFWPSIGSELVRVLPFVPTEICGLIRQYYS